MGRITRIVSASVITLAGSCAFAQQDASPYSLALSSSRAPAQGLNLAVVGSAHLSSFGVFGKVGTLSYSRSDTSAMGMGVSLPPEQQSGGLSWGGGVSYDFTPRLSATFEWVSYDLRMPTGPVRSTDLGLQYRY